jgi:hypothetical protein
MMIARFRRAHRIVFSARQFSTQERSLNVIQELPSYQKALELVVDERYSESQ